MKTFTIYDGQTILVSCTDEKAVDEFLAYRTAQGKSNAHLRKVEEDAEVLGGKLKNQAAKEIIHEAVLDAHKNDQSK